MGQTIRLVVADDQASARAGLKAVLANYPQFEVLADAANGQEAIELVERWRPDVVLMDARMPVLDGLQATQVIKRRWPQTRVVVLSMYVARAYALAAGADAFLLKGAPVEGLLAELMAGEPPGSCEVGYVQDNIGAVGSVTAR
ncbi:MAG: response regulator transcription factor [Chloroflexi bacterium]|nr:response regulator transcription factor [Chloroflexota bacterium]MCL5273402.1 response regulator transcription factor [Chloroflexota bacterium]